MIKLISLIIDIELSSRSTNRFRLNEAIGGLHVGGILSWLAHVG
ncbi:hypothetical protein VCR14J2_230204 [Vibrio coralliirubri]|nr:hypothetical protein VCR14J2_230204 [Vibrio coralliirubri]